jgi:hypothetical protein
MTRSISVRPPTVCSTFGVGDFIRVPWPAARMTAHRLGMALLVRGPESGVALERDLAETAARFDG